MVATKLTKSHPKSRIKEETTLLLWVAMGFLYIFLFIAPFQKGLFNALQPSFDLPIYYTSLFACVFLLGYGVNSLFNLENIHFTKKNVYVSLLLWLLPVSYTISYFISASKSNAMNSICVSIINVAAFILSQYMIRKKTNVILFGYMAAAFFLVLFGYINWFGGFKYKDAVLGYRLANIFQYPNTYAAYLLAVLACTLFIGVRSVNKKFVFLTNTSMVIPLIASFLLTSSRGALVIVPIIAILLLIFLSFIEQVFLIIQLLLGAVGAFIITPRLTAIGSEFIEGRPSASLAVEGWIILIGSSLVFTIIILFLNRYVFEKLIIRDRDEKFSVKSIILPLITTIGSVSAGILLLSGNSVLLEFLPITFRRRLEGIDMFDTSIIGRVAYNKDALQLFKDYPIFGRGGGAWPALYEEYQSFSYISRQTHNFFLQLLTDIGIFGTFVYIALVVSIMIMFIVKLIKGHIKKENIVYLLFLVALLSHSALDFDMTFVYISGLIFVSLGAMAGLIIQGDRAKNIAINPKIRIAAPSTLCLVSLLILIISSMMISADSAYKKGLRNINLQGELSDTLDYFETAVSRSMNNPYYLYTEVDIYKSLFQQTKEEKYYLKALELNKKLRASEPNFKLYFDSQVDLLIINNQREKATIVLEDALRIYEWNLPYYDKLFSLYYDLAISDSQLYLRYMDKIIALYDKLEGDFEVQRLKFQENAADNSFKLNENIATIMGTVYFREKDYSKCSEILKNIVNRKYSEGNQKYITRIYLASLFKQNLLDEVIFKEFIQLYPEEKDLIQTLS